MLSEADDDDDERRRDGEGGSFTLTAYTAARETPAGGNYQFETIGDRLSPLRSQLTRGMFRSCSKTVSLYVIRNKENGIKVRSTSNFNGSYPRSVVRSVGKFPLNDSFSLFVYLIITNSTLTRRYVSYTKLLPRSIRDYRGCFLSLFNRKLTSLFYST